MPKENRSEFNDSETLLPPKYFQVRGTGKLFQLDGENQEGVLATELDRDTFQPIAASSAVLGTREELARVVTPFPAADNDFLRSIQASRKVTEVATKQSYEVLNCNLDEAVLREVSSGKTIRVPIENLYQSYKVEAEPKNVVCQVCSTTQSDTNRLLN